MGATAEHLEHTAVGDAFDRTEAARSVGDAVRGLLAQLARVLDDQRARLRRHH